MSPVSWLLRLLALPNSCAGCTAATPCSDPSIRVRRECMRLLRCVAVDLGSPQASGQGGRLKELCWVLGSCLTWYATS